MKIPKTIEVLVDETDMAFVYKSIEVQEVVINERKYDLYRGAEFWKKDAENPEQIIYYNKEYPVPENEDVYYIVDDINTMAAEEAYRSRHNAYIPDDIPEWWFDSKDLDPDFIEPLNTTANRVGSLSSSKPRF